MTVKAGDLPLYLASCLALPVSVARVLFRNVAVQIWWKGHHSDPLGMFLDSSQTLRVYIPYP